MPVHQFTRIAVTLVALLLSTSAYAQSPQNITISPSPTVNQPVVVTVNGPNPCGAVGINYGDGESIVYPISELPMRQTHIYKTPGQKVVSAQGHGNCTGLVSTTITVAPAPAPPAAPAAPAPIAPRPALRSLDELCGRIDCARGGTKTAIVEVFGVHRPGGTAGISGTGLGSQQGFVRAYLKRRDGSTLVQELRVTSWTDGIIEASWPVGAPSDLPDQDATLQIETGNHVRSNDFRPVPYSPVRLANQNVENATVHEKVVRREAVRQEAHDLWMKGQRATPADAAAIDRRAAELLASLDRIR